MIVVLSYKLLKVVRRLGRIFGESISENESALGTTVRTVNKYVVPKFGDFYSWILDE